MSKVILVLKNPAPEISAILQFVVENKFNDFSLLSEMRETIKEKFKDNYNELSEKKRTAYVKLIKNFNFKDNKNYQEKSGNADDLWNFIDTLKRFQESLLVVIELEYNKNRESYMMEHQVSPPIEAYNYKSAADIKSSGRSFGTLFE
jgi:hypothetical protein